MAGFGIALSVLPAAQGANDTGAYRQLDLFSDAFERVRANYVRPVQDSELVNAAIQGMVSSLDPHSSYMDAKAYADMQITTKGEFGGVGIEVTQEDGLIKVISPIDGTPAAKAGIKSGDRIAAHRRHLDPGHGAQRRHRQDARPGRHQDHAHHPARRREEAVRRDAAARHRAGGRRHMAPRRRCRLYPPAGLQRTDRVAAWKRRVRELKKQIGPGIKGYVLDLRNNPGGLLDQAIQVSDDFLNGGEIVSTRGRHPEDTQRYDAKGGDITDGKPVVVLINAGTASASEIVSGALQDHKRATIVGMTSFGKGSVQTIIPLGEGGGALRLTTARYYTPSGHSIQAQGIIPDIAVAQGDEDQCAQDRAAVGSRSAGPSGRRAGRQEGQRAGDPAGAGQEV